MIKPPHVALLSALVTCATVTIASATPLVPRAAAPRAISVPFMRRVHTPPHPPARHVWINPYLHSGHGKPGTWQPLNAAPPFGNNGGGTALLMTDGTVMVHDNEASWYRLTPDQFGSYVNGTWSQAASLPAGYGPLYYASAVLPDGRISVEGGEYNFFQLVETNLGAIYDPVANQWTSVSPPSGYSEIGDASSVVLQSGTLMIGNCCYSSQALFNEKSLSWTLTGSGKADANSEEGWTLLPDGTVLTVDVFNANHAERYDPSTGSWSSAGTVPVNLIQSYEIGPQVLRPDGTVLAVGASGHNAIYNTSTGQWSAGPDFPIIGGQQLDSADGPATLLPDGNVLVPASPGVYNAPAYFYEFDGTSFISVPNPPNAPIDSSYNIRLLMLPTGQVLYTDGYDDAEIYTPKGKPVKGIEPKIVSVPTTLTHGQTYTLRGKRLNGISQANMYGDDAQMATNYPLVRITNNATGHVFYARTHNFSSMAVASSAKVKTKFDVPSTIELGASTLVVVTNGIVSKPVAVTVN